MQDHADSESTKGRPKIFHSKYKRYLRFLSNAGLAIKWGTQESMYRLAMAIVAGSVIFLTTVSALAWLNRLKAVTGLEDLDFLSISKALALNLLDAATLNALSIARIAVPEVGGGARVKLMMTTMNMALAYVVLRTCIHFVQTFWTACLCVLFPEPMNKVAKGRSDTWLLWFLKNTSYFRVTAR